MEAKVQELEKIKADFSHNSFWLNYTLIDEQAWADVDLTETIEEEDWEEKPEEFEEKPEEFEEKSMKIQQDAWTDVETEITKGNLGEVGANLAVDPGEMGNKTLLASIEHFEKTKRGK